MYDAEEGEIINNTKLYIHALEEQKRLSGLQDEVDYSSVPHLIILNSQVRLCTGCILSEFSFL